MSRTKYVIVALCSTIIWVMQCAKKNMTQDRFSYLASKLPGPYWSSDRPGHQTASHTPTGKRMFPRHVKAAAEGWIGNDSWTSAKAAVVRLGAVVAALSFKGSTRRPSISVSLRRCAAEAVERGLSCSQTVFKAEFAALSVSTRTSSIASRSCPEVLLPLTSAQRMQLSLRKRASRECRPVDSALMTALSPRSPILLFLHPKAEYKGLVR